MKRKDWNIILILLIVIAIIGYVIYHTFVNMSPVLLTILSGAFGFIVSKIYESIKENKQRTYDKKREIYYRLIKPYREVLFPGKNKSNELTEDQIKDAIEAAFDNILYASDEVIKSYGTFRNISLNGDKEPEYVLKQFATLLKAMRKDLGNQFSTLDEVEILKMFINMSIDDEKGFREKFKSL